MRRSDHFKDLIQPQSRSLPQTRSKERSIVVQFKKKIQLIRSERELTEPSARVWLGSVLDRGERLNESNETSVSLNE